MAGSPDGGCRAAELAGELKAVLDIVAVIIPGYVEVGIIIRAVEGQRRYLVLRAGQI
jgi:hypothetical protein